MASLTGIVAGIIVVLIATGGGNASKKIAPESSAARVVTSEVTALLAGIPQAGNALGRPTAPVTLQYFGDLGQLFPFVGLSPSRRYPRSSRSGCGAETYALNPASLEPATREREYLDLRPSRGTGRRPAEQAVEFC